MVSNNKQVRLPVSLYIIYSDPALIEVSDVDNTTQKLTSTVKDQLLLGLGDEADEIKSVKIVNLYLIFSFPFLDSKCMSSGIRRVI